MAELSRKNKKLLLFISSRNSFWSFIIPGIIHQDDIAGFCDIAESTFSHWKKSWVVGDDSVDKIFTAIREILGDGKRTIKPTNGKGLKKNQKSEYTISAPADLEKANEIFSRFYVAYNDEKAGVYETGKALNMKISECQKILDTLIYDKFPLFAGIYYNSDTAASVSFDTYGGIYFLWVKRNRTWLQCPLRIRYTLKILGLPTIRCKLNAPILGLSGRYWEYDGFLTSTSNRNYWIFEKRLKDHRYDHFYFITTLEKYFPPGEELLTMRGNYLSADQDQKQTIVNGIVFLQRQDVDEENEVEVMHTQARRLSEAEGKSIQEHYDEFDEFLKRDHVER